jgi:tetratricopeptide (TPR) repeat protein
MAPLYAAVAHGCEAGRHQEALVEIYYKRICRERQFFSTQKLGAFGADLAALIVFFAKPWQQPITALTDDAKSFVLGIAGFRLRVLGRLTEAVQPMQAGLESALLLKNWENAAIAAGNLSELYLAIGDLLQALSYAEKSVQLADKSGDSFQRAGKRTTLANALHQEGRLSDAEAAFRKAEQIHTERQPDSPLLYSLPGFRYCDLLLSQGKYSEVQTRAAQILQWANQMTGVGLLDIALIHLSLGQAYLLDALQEGTEDFNGAAEQLNRAIEGIRLAGTIEQLPRGLLARAEMHRVKREFNRALADLDEAMDIATRGSMGLYQADCHLEYAQLHLAQGEKKKAQENWAKAKEMIERMGYHRRDKDVVEIERQLEKMPG